METTENTISVNEVRCAIEQLKCSGRGKKALQVLTYWLLDSAVGLDYANQDAVVTLLLGAWGPHAGTTLELLSEECPGVLAPIDALKQKLDRCRQAQDRIEASRLALQARLNRIEEIVGKMGARPVALDNRVYDQILDAIHGVDR